MNAHTPVTAESASTPERMPTFATSTVMSLLWQEASKGMDLKELEWLASGAVHQVGAQTRALSQVLDDVSCLVMGDDDVGAFQDSHSTANLLQNIHHQLDTIAALADLGADAGYRVLLALKGGAA